jgi:hypothetical protein
MVIFAAAYLPRSTAMLFHYHNTGDGYTSPAWRNSLTIQAVRQLSPSIPIISNNSGAILFLTGRMALEVGEIYRTEPQVPYTRYGEDTTDPTQLVFRQQGSSGHLLILRFIGNSTRSIKIKPVLAWMYSCKS